MALFHCDMIALLTGAGRYLRGKQNSALYRLAMQVKMKKTCMLTVSECPMHPRWEEETPWG